MGVSGTYKWNRLEYFLVLRDALGRKTQPRREEMVRELIEEINREKEIGRADNHAQLRVTAAGYVGAEAESRGRANR